MSYHHIVWIIGPAAERAPFDALLDGSPAQVYHPSLGHSVATASLGSFKDSRWAAPALDLARNNPNLVALHAQYTPDDNTRIARWSLSQGAVTLDEQVIKTYTLSIHDVLLQTEQAWLPLAMRLAQAVPLPDGTALQQATWRDDGNEVARLLSDPIMCPTTAEQWWDGLAAACRREGFTVHSTVLGLYGERLHGRLPTWSRSAADAWADAFPSEFRDVHDFIKLTENCDVPTRASLARWVPAATLYEGARRPSLDGQSVFHWSASKLLFAINDLWNVPSFVLDEHVRLLASMPVSDRDPLLNEFLADGLHMREMEAPLDHLLVETLGKLESSNIVPAAWKEASITEWLRSARVPKWSDSQVARWLQHHRVQQEQERLREAFPAADPTPSRPRSRL